MNEYETIFIYLNTSHVKVKLMKNIGMDADELYLNTSHVKVKHADSVAQEKKAIFKYISC